MGRLIEIRPEQPGDEAAVAAVVEAAFGQPDEAQLVEAVRAAGGITLSLVAVIDDQIVGHILFSPAHIENCPHIGAGLAPLSVLPAFQKTGIGAALTHAGLAGLRHTGCPFSIVLGHKNYYPRFGYVPAHTLGVECPFPIPDPDAFMALVLDAKKMQGVSGKAQYHPAFG